MSRRARKVLLTAGPAVLVIVLGAASSSAARATWTISPGGSFTATGTVRATDPSTGGSISCQASLGGTLKRGSGLSGAGIGSVTSASFTRCKAGTIAFTVTVGPGSLPWEVSALSYNATSGVTTGSLEDIDLQASATGCNAALDGTADNANNGLAKFSYADSTGVLKLTGGGDLHYWDIINCFGFINPGDSVKVTGSLNVTPKQAITSP